MSCADMLIKVAKEGSTFIIVVSFFGEDGAAAVPNTMLWSLYDEKGNIVNSKEAISVAPGEVISIILSGDDLKGLGNEVCGLEERTFKIFGKYDSVDYGNDLDYASVVSFNLQNMPG